MAASIKAASVFCQSEEWVVSQKRVTLKLNGVCFTGSGGGGGLVGFCFEGSMLKMPPKTTITKTRVMQR